MRRAYELRPNVTAYDASYVALAELLNCELLTGDQRLVGRDSMRCCGDEDQEEGLGWCVWSPSMWQR
jgi:hypothetical protein